MLPASLPPGLGCCPRHLLRHGRGDLRPQCGHRSHARCCPVSRSTLLRWKSLASPGTDLRPAHLLTSALGNATTALDISVCSPHAQQAGPDCTRSRLAAKLDHCVAHLRQNISHTPRSCWLLVDLRAPLDPDLQPVAGAPLLPAFPLRAPWSGCVPGSASLCGVPAFSVSDLSRFSRICWSFAGMSRSDQLRQLATQLDSLAALEDTVAQGIHSLLVPAPEPRRQLACSPLRVCVSFSLALLCAQARADSAWGRSCSVRVARPWLHRSAPVSLASALAHLPQLPCRRSQRSLRAPLGLALCPRLAVRVLVCTQLARQDPPDAAEARRRSRDQAGQANTQMLVKNHTPECTSSKIDQDESLRVLRKRVPKRTNTEHDWRGRQD